MRTVSMLVSPLEARQDLTHPISPIFYIQSSELETTIASPMLSCAVGAAVGGHSE